MCIDVVKPPSKDREEKTRRALNWAQCMFLSPPRKFKMEPIGKRIEVKNG